MLAILSVFPAVGGDPFDKSLVEKLAVIEQLDKKDKIAFYAVLDAFIGKKKLKDALSNVLSDVK